MIFATDILPRWTETLGWTLLNSMWQAAFISLLIIFVLRILPQRFSRVRYAMACAGILVIFVSSAITFSFIQSKAVESSSSDVAYLLSSAMLAGPGVDAESSDLWLKQTLGSAVAAIDNNMSLILLAWSLGALGFSLRLVSGWWFISTLKSESRILSDEWSAKLQTLANDLGMSKIIQLAESARITTPMVIGFFKPVVLVPAGMLAGLSSSQIETIFLHELAHIRRHDYIINLAQTFIETIFFFNPFVWILSGIVRREREYCCDDDVVSIHGSSLDYAKALTQLEEWKLTRSTFGLALAANKNQLLHRIKRIMEKTGEKYSAKDRFVPAVLLIVGLVCASWLTVQKNQDTSSEENYSEDNTSIAQDTTIKKGKSSRTTIITIDENGEAHEQIFEEIDGDTDVAFWVPAPPTPFADFAIPPVPAVPAYPNFPAFPSVPPFPTAPAHVWDLGMTPSIDTIPGAWFKHGGNWEKFSEEFEKKFSEEFSEFYKTHEKDFDKMMKDMERRFKDDFENGNLQGFQLMDVPRMEELAALESLKLNEYVSELEALELAQGEALASLDVISEMPLAVDVQALSADMARLERGLVKLDGRMDDFNKELKNALVEDGYLKKSDELKNINWDDTAIKINGKKVKEEHRKKYQALHDKYWNFVPNKVE